MRPPPASQSRVPSGPTIDLARLAEELSQLRTTMRQETKGKPEQDEAIGEVAKAEKAAGQGDDRTTLRHLKATGTWTLGGAEKIGVPLAGTLYPLILSLGRHRAPNMGARILYM